jgi:DNA-binding MarR family transcriptional regulator
MNTLELSVWERVLVYLNDKRRRRYVGMSISMISQDLRITYSHISNIIDILYYNGFISLRKIGRTVEVRLTPAGIKLSGYIYHTAKMLSENTRK